MKKKPQEMDEQELLYALLADKVGAVDPKDVFFAKRIDSGKSAGKYHCLIGGKKLTANQATNLKAEVNTLIAMGIWKLFTETLTHEAKLRMFKHAKTERDMDWGKSILHSVGIMETIVESIRNAEVD